jgi:hypothetical protein
MGVLGRSLVAALALLLVAVLALRAALERGRRWRGRRGRAAAYEAAALGPAPRVAWRERVWAASAEAPAPAPPAPAAPAPGAPSLHTLRVRPLLPQGLRLPTVDVTLARQGDDGSAESPETVRLEGSLDGVFAIHWLEPGAYDVTVAAPDGLGTDLRDARARWTAPGDGQLEVPLGRGAVVQGAVGPAGRDCRRLYVHMTDAGGGVQTAQAVGADCTFALVALSPGPVTVAAVLPEGRVRLSVAVPDGGDPPPLCLVAPCPRLPATVAVWVADARGQLAPGVWLARDMIDPDTGGGEVSMETTRGLTFWNDLHPGDRIHVRAGSDESEGEADVVAGFGVTDAVVRLR